MQARIAAGIISI